jgi:hypothetical protein
MSNPDNVSHADGTEERLVKLEEENTRLKSQLNEIESTLDDIRGGQDLNEETDEDLEAASAEGFNDVSENGDSNLLKPTPSRRGVLSGVAAMSLLGLGAAGTASAASDGDALQFGTSYSGNSSNNNGLKLVETSQSGNSWGMWAETESTGGKAVQAIATADSGRTMGVNGFTTSPSGIGVRGRAASGSGSVLGVLGEVESPDGKALQGTNRALTGTAVGLEGRSDSSAGIALRGRSKAGSGQTYGVWGEVQSPNGYGLYTPDDAKIDGDLHVEGQKNFVQSVDTPDGPKQVHYTAIEAGKALTEVSDVAELSDGRAEIDLPEHFGMVTSEEEDLTVQVTPYAKEEANPQVVHRSTDRIVVEDFAEETYDYTFAYTVKGVREGFEDVDVVQN